jgi:hypothetical protein
MNCRIQSEITGPIPAGAPQHAALGCRHIVECSNNRHLMWLEYRELRFRIAMRRNRQSELRWEGSAGESDVHCNGPSVSKGARGAYRSKHCTP